MLTQKTQKVADKRGQNQTCLNYAECKRVRRSQNAANAEKNDRE